MWVKKYTFGSLSRIFPDQLEDKQKNNKIEYLLKRLRIAGKIHNRTKGNESVWSLGKI